MAACYACGIRRPCEAIAYASHTILILRILEPYLETILPQEWMIFIKPLCCFILSIPLLILSTAASRTLATLGLPRARHLLEEGQKKLKLFVENPNAFWMTLHVIEVLSVVMLFCAGYLFLDALEIKLTSWIIWLILAAVYFIAHTVIGVSIANGDERKLAPHMGLLIKPFYFCLRPLTWILCLLLKPFSRKPDEKFADAERIEEEFEVMLDESTRQGGLENAKSKIMRSAIDYSETTVREVMIPRTELTACSVDTPIDEAFELYVREGYSRLPVYEGNIDTIVGVLYFKDLVQKYFELRDDDENRQKVSLKSLVREAFFVPETNHIDAIFEDFKREHIHMAIVVDEFGGTAGLVTLEDIVEEFFGEIQDEYDSEENAIVPIDNENQIVLVDAKTSISEIAEHFDVELEENPDYESIGGLVTYKLGHVGTIGEEVDEAGLHFIVRDASERCILQVEISKTETPDSEKDE